MKLSELGELGLLAELEQRGLVVDVANDAALLRRDLVATQDALVENVHFTLDRVGWRDLGWHAAAVNLSDLAASGAKPEALLVTLAVPRETNLADVVAFYEGIAEAGVPVVGGDTSSAALVLISVTALGQSQRVPGRQGARPGDLLVVTGPLGAAGAAFRRQTYVRPPIRLAEGLRLGATAHAVVDLSDGLSVDAAHIARRSGVRCVVELERVPLAEGATHADVGFGEDFELLAAVEQAEGLAVVGRVEEGEGLVVLLDGRPTRLPGWEHFV